MSDNTINEDEVISQDDIDKLLNASISDGDKAGADNNADNTVAADNDLAELSQDDIDSLLNGASLGPDSSDNKVKDEKSDELELVSQNDIDQLMDAVDLSDNDINSSSGSIVDPGISKPTFDTEIDNSDDYDDFDFISQDDVKQLMDTGALSDDDSNPSPDTELLASSSDRESSEIPEIGSNISEESDELELVSQDDIDKLMNGDFQKNTIDNEISYEEDYGKESDLSSDVQVDDKIEEQALDESEALDIGECLITQETIDQLIKQDIKEPAILPESAGEPNSYPKEEMEPDQTQEAEPNKDEESQGEQELDEPADVTQDDIDNILDNSEKGTDDVSEEISNLISQDDINKLLEGTDEDDEDILGNLDEESSGENMYTGDGSNVDSKKDISKEDQVILEAVDEDGTDGLVPDSAEQIDVERKQEKERHNKLKKQWYGSRLVVAVFGTILLFLFLGGGYFFFFHGLKTSINTQPRTVQGKLNTGIVTHTGNINFNKPVFPHGPGNIAIKDFIVLSPDGNKSLSYITADISIYYSKGSALNEIKKHLPFYRGIIYDTIKKFLTVARKKDINEKKLSDIIRNALNQVMPKNYIDQVIFTDFRTG